MFPWDYSLHVQFQVGLMEAVKQEICQQDEEEFNQIFMLYPWYNVFKESKVHFCSSDSQRSLSFIIISKQFSPHPVKLSLNSCVCCHAASPSPPFRTASNTTSVAPEKSE